MASLRILKFCSLKKNVIGGQDFHSKSLSRPFNRWMYPPVLKRSDLFYFLINLQIALLLSM